MRKKVIYLSKIILFFLAIIGLIGSLYSYWYLFNGIFDEKDFYIFLVSTIAGIAFSLCYIVFVLKNGLSKSLYNIAVIEKEKIIDTKNAKRKNKKPSFSRNLINLIPRTTNSRSFYLKGQIWQETLYYIIRTAITG